MQKSEVCYQIYPLSFCDSNRDGFGDFLGIISQLDYLKDLGIDRIWISSCWQSEMFDHGYDVSDYKNTNQRLGTLDELKLLINKAHDLGLKVMLDGVFNHTSSNHLWFHNSELSLQGYENYYYWWDNPNLKLQDMNGQPQYSFSQQRNAYYLHLFGAGQVDLNWSEPSVRQAVADVIQEWMSWGIDGIRFDVLDMIGKDPLQNKIINNDVTHRYLKELAGHTFQSKADFMTIGECWSAGLNDIYDYTHDGQEISHVFTLQLFTNDFGDYGQWSLRQFSLSKLKESLMRYQNRHDCGMVNVLSNHDIPRMITRVFGTDGVIYQEAISKMLMCLLLTLNGIPCIYQGEEIGMTGITDFSSFQFQDNQTQLYLKHYYDYKNTMQLTLENIYRGSRDNSRTMVQWHSEQINNPSWIGVNANTSHINVEAQTNRVDSVLMFVKQLIALRKNTEYEAVLTEGDFEVLSTADNLIGYIKTTFDKRILCLHNWTATAVEVMKCKNLKVILANNWLSSSGLLDSYGTVVFDISDHKEINSKFLQDDTSK